MSFFGFSWLRRRPPAVDESTLPKLETLTGDSDITAFLAAGVSQALQSQALRIAWKADARIAGFRGMADYDWDFNAEGYGRLALSDDVANLLQRVITPTPPAPAPVQVAAIEPPAPIAAENPAVDPSPRPVPRRHGGALPA
jgi:hypothetical protein